MAQQAGLKSGTIYPLVRLEEYKWVTSDWEETDPVVEGRRRRRYYKLSPMAPNELATISTRPSG